MNFKLFYQIDIILKFYDLFVFTIFVCYFVLFYFNLGDWLILKSLVEVDKDAVDHCGKVLQIDALMPLRSRVQKGKITHWESQFNQGIIDSQTLFTLDSCDLGYIPVVGDEVLLSCIYFIY